MKPVKQRENNWQYELATKEKAILQSLLKQFPITELNPVKMSKGHPDAESLDREILLNQALAQHREELKRSAQQLLETSLHQSEGVWHLTLDAAAKEKLLQVLNDIRVGCWRALGEPEEIHEPPKDSPNHIRLWTIMNLAGYFEEHLAG